VAGNRRRRSGYMVERSAAVGSVTAAGFVSSCLVISRRRCEKVRPNTTWKRDIPVEGPAVHSAPRDIQPV